MDQRLHRRLREVTGVEDAYRAEKDRHNRMVMRLLPELRERIDAADDPFGLAVKLAIAGNIIDLGVNGRVAEDDLRRSRRPGARRAGARAGRGPPARHLAGPHDILYLADNCGEIVFDRLLIERPPIERVTVAVRGRPSSTTPPWSTPARSD